MPTGREFIDFKILNQEVSMSLRNPENNIIIGTASISFDWKNNYSILEEIFIKEEYQKQGYGSYFIHKIFKICEEEKLEKILLCTSPNNPTLGDFYQKLGFKKRLMTELLPYDYEIIIPKVVFQKSETKISEKENEEDLVLHQ